MTAYQGGKKRIGKKIYTVIDIIENDISPDDKLPYFEPFIGMAGVMRHFSILNDRETYASDLNEDIILMWKAVQKGWKPPTTCTPEKYEKLKNNKKHSAERGFLGVVASFGCTFFNSYRKDNKFIMEGVRGIENIREDIMSVNFLESQSYNEFNPKGMLIYCDPPYKNNNIPTKFFRKFDHDSFWETMRKWSENNIVIVSESSAPKDFKKVWCTSSHVSNQYQTKKYDDCLYMHQNIYKALSSKSIRKMTNIH